MKRAIAVAVVIRKKILLSVVTLVRNVYVLAPLIRGIIVRIIVLRGIPGCKDNHEDLGRYKNSSAR